MITVYFIKGKSVTSRVFMKKSERYIIGISIRKKSRAFFFPLFLSPSPSPDTLFLSSLFFSFFFFSSFSLLLFFSGQPLLRRVPPPASQHQVDQPVPKPVAQLASSQPRAQAARQLKPNPAQSRPASSNPPCGQLVRELSRSR